MSHVCRRLRTRLSVLGVWGLGLSIACDGVDGKAGRDGADGAAGVAGEAGPPGTDGADGADGADGTDGRNADDIDQDGDGLPVTRDCDDSDPTLGERVVLYLDYDGDGFGTPHVAQSVCEIPAGWVEDTSDCDDLDASVNPDGQEVCNGGTDDDCDGLADAADDSLDLSTGTVFFVDGDGDGHGDAEQLACALEAGLVEADGDCDDTDADVHPDAEEVCDDGIDQNCNGVADGCEWAAALDTDDADVELEGESSSDRFGTALAAADVDGDGYDDLLVGAPNTDDNGSGAGAVYALRGATSAASWSDADAVRMDGPAASAAAGSAVSRLGDLDGDGTDETGFSATGEDQAYLVYGGPSAWATAGDADTLAVTLTTDAVVSLFGRELAAGGDVDADGFDDLLVSDEGGASADGVVYLLLGSTTAWSSPTTVSDIAHATFSTDSTGDELGERGTLGHGDYDGDGLADLVLGEPGHDAAGNNYGRVYVFYGSSSVSGAVDVADADTIVDASDADDNQFLGDSVADLGDVDGDGSDDLGLGAIAFDDSDTQNAGSIYVYLGDGTGFDAALGVTDASAQVMGEAEKDYLGSSLAVRADVDGDGVFDIVAGARGYADAASTGGHFVYYGGTHVDGSTWDLSDADITLQGTSALEGLGEELVAGDFDADGYTDLAVGAAGHRSYRGGVFVFFGTGL